MRYQFSSCKNKHAPTVLKEAMAQYKTNPALGMQCMHDWSGDVPPITLQQLLSGELPYVIEGNAVYFEKDEGETKETTKAKRKTETT